MKKPASLLLVLSALALAACGGDTSSSVPGGGTASDSTDTDTSSTTPVGGDGTSSSSSTTPEVTTYIIRINNVSGATVTADKERAAEGETVNLTVVIDDGYTLKSLTYNGTALTVDAEGHASFVMPNRSVTISISLSIAGDVTVQGDIAAVLQEEEPGSGLYVARNIKVASDAQFSFYVKDSELSVIDVDYTKCFANVESAYNDADGELILAGGATYDFYYDENADPAAGHCYIKKVHQDTLPTDVNTFHALFEGRVRSESPMNLDGVKQISYTNATNDVKYEYTNYTDGSHAEATKVSDGTSLGVVNKVYDASRDYYRIVDSYVEWGEKHYSGANTTAHAGKYGVVATEGDIESDYSRYQVSEHDANYLAHSFSHGMESLRFDIQNAYYVGFDASADIGTEGLGLFDRTVTSEQTEDGFDVNLTSWREIDTTSSTHVDEADKEVSYYAYTVDASFDEAGRILSISYSGKRYGEDDYDFTNHQIIPGHENNGTVIGDMEATYTYGDPTGKNTYDDSAYFTSTLTAAIRDDDLGDEYASKNAIQKSNLIQSASLNDHMVLTSDKATALDLILDEDATYSNLTTFTIICSSNTKVIGNVDGYGRFTFMPLAAGKATITIGNPALPEDIAPRVEIEVEVIDNARVRSFYLTGKDGVWSESQNLLDTSTSFTMACGTSRTFRIIGSPYDYNVPVTLEADSDALEVRSYLGSDGYYYLFADATKSSVTAATDITVTVQSDYYMDDWKDNPTEISITLLPADDFDPFGTWYYITDFTEDYVASAVDKNTVVTIRDYDPEDPENTRSTVQVGDDLYYFGFNIDPETGVFSYTRLDGGNVATVMVAETVDGYLGVILQADDGSWSGMDEVTDGTWVLGYVETDEEYEVLNYQFDSFAPEADWAA